MHKTDTPGQPLKMQCSCPSGRGPENGHMHNASPQNPWCTTPTKRGMQQKISFFRTFFPGTSVKWSRRWKPIANKQVAASDKQGTTLTPQCFCPSSLTNGHCPPQSSLCKSRLKSRRYLFQNKILYFCLLFCLLVFAFVLLTSSACGQRIQEGPILPVQIQQMSGLSQ